jgi:hypothetical protein
MGDALPRTEADGHCPTCRDQRFSVSEPKAGDQWRGDGGHAAERGPEVELRGIEFRDLT